MAHPFEITMEVEAEATPEQAWEAITTGRGQDSWFMGSSEIEPREGGKVRWSIGDFTQESTVITWDPPHRFVNGGSEGVVGASHQFDYTIEERGPGRSGIKYVHSGMLGDDWEAEYEAMSEGDPMYVMKLVEYLEHFLGRFAVGVNLVGPQAGTREEVLATFRRALGMPDGLAEGDHVHLTPQGFEPIDGEIDYLRGPFIGVRTDDAMYRFIYGYTGEAILGHHLFGDVDQAKAERDWREWLERTFAGAGSSA